MTTSPAHEWRDPRILRVEWLEDAMLLHAITLTHEPRPAAVDRLFYGALACGGLGVGLLGAGQLALAGVAGVAWAGCAVGLGVEAWRVGRRPPAARRRLLIELRAEQIAWTLLEGDRWSMRHQHELPLPTLTGARALATPHGPEVEVAQAGGGTRRIPLHGLPDEDARWLVERIEEGIAAAALPDELEERPWPTPTT